MTTPKGQLRGGHRSQLNVDGSEYERRRWLRLPEQLLQTFIGSTDDLDLLRKPRSDHIASCHCAQPVI